MATDVILGRLLPEAFGEPKEFEKSADWQEKQAEKDDEEDEEYEEDEEEKPQ